jgi:hypothetical protein
VGRALKKRDQAVPKRVPGHSAEAERRVHRPDGGRARRPKAASRSVATARLSRRDLEAAGG